MFCLQPTWVLYDRFISFYIIIVEENFGTSLFRFHSSAPPYCLTRRPRTRAPSLRRLGALQGNLLFSRCFFFTLSDDTMILLIYPLSMYADFVCLIVGSWDSEAIIIDHIIMSAMFSWNPRWARTYQRPLRLRSETATGICGPRLADKPFSDQKLQPSLFVASTLETSGHIRRRWQWKRPRVVGWLFSVELSVGMACQGHAAAARGSSTSLVSTNIAQVLLSISFRVRDSILADNRRSHYND